MGMVSSDYELLESLFPFYIFDPDAEKCRTTEVPVVDCIALLHLLQEYKPKTILEIGAWTGSCTCLLGSFVKGLGGGKVHSIDNFNGSPGSDQTSYGKIARRRFLYNVKKFELEDTVVLHEGNSDDFADLDVKFDMVFIDADHRYSQINRDILNYYPKVKVGGIICGHDFNSATYDEKFIEDDYVNGVHHGVSKAVIENFPKMKLFMNPEEGKTYSLISSVWFNVKNREPCFVAMD